MTALGALIEHWRSYTPIDGDYFHRRDAPFLTDRNLPIHADVQAYPYVGDLRNADVWLLMLNSKLGARDQAEESTEPYRQLFKKNLYQQFEDVEFPLLSLNPALSQTGTYQYYNHARGLSELALELARRVGATELDARRILSRRVAILELLPYRSESFPAALKSLPSINLARRAAHEALETKLVVVPWGIANWGLKSGDNVLNESARSFTFASHGKAGYGAAILNRLMRDLQPKV